MLEIVYQDAHIVAINKPHGLLVHASPIARDAEEFALQLLRDQLQQTVYPAHRLDRKTSGLLLFSLSKDVDKLLQKQFNDQQIDKKYLAILRGFTPTDGTIDYDLTREEDGKVQQAITHYRRIATSEIELASGKFSTSRYSLIEAHPETGRFHQLRKHFAHIFHPILGDRPHGCNKQNKLWKETYEMESMLLHASELTFFHPITAKKIQLKAKPQAEFLRVCNILQFNTEI